MLNPVKHKLLLASVSNSGINLNPKSLVMLGQKRLMQGLKMPYRNIGDFLEYFRLHNLILLNFQKIVRVIHI